MPAAEDLDPSLEAFERQFRCDVALALALTMSAEDPPFDLTPPPGSDQSSSEVGR